MVSRDAIPLDSASVRRCLHGSVASARRLPPLRCAGCCWRGVWRQCWGHPRRAAYRRTRPAALTSPPSGMCDAVPKSPCGPALILGVAFTNPAANHHLPRSAPSGGTRAAPPKYGHGVTPWAYVPRLPSARRIRSFWLSTLRPRRRHLRPGSAVCLRVTFRTSWHLAQLWVVPVVVGEMPLRLGPIRCQGHGAAVRRAQAASGISRAGNARGGSGLVEGVRARYAALCAQRTSRRQPEAARGHPDGYAKTRSPRRRGRGAGGAKLGAPARGSHLERRSAAQRIATAARPATLPANRPAARVGRGRRR
jgi:hypothetical protein